MAKNEPPTRRLRSGTPSRAPAFSYHASRSLRDTNVGRELPTREQPKHRRPHSWRGWAILAAAVVLAGLLLFSSADPKLVITGTSDQQGLLQPAAVYQAAAQKIMSSQPQSHFKPTLDEASVSIQLRKQFPELASATVRQSVWSNRPTVAVTGYIPELLLDGQGGTFVVDQTGTARLAAADLPDALRTKLPLVVDQSGLAVSVGQPILPSTDVEFISTVLAELTAVHLTWQQLTLPSASSELDVTLTGQSYFVKFALQGGAAARQQVGTFLAAKQQLDATHVTPAHYIDVRVPERAYYN